MFITQEFVLVVVNRVSYVPYLDPFEALKKFMKNHFSKPDAFFDHVKETSLGNHVKLLWTHRDVKAPPQ